jgi:hypothetical protein
MQEAECKMQDQCTQVELSFGVKVTSEMGVLGKHPREALGAEVGVYFPQLRTGDVKARRATVSRRFPQHDDDVVLLNLASGATPLGPEQIAVLGGADQSEAVG